MRLWYKVNIAGFKAFHKSVINSYQKVRIMPEMSCRPPNFENQWTLRKTPKLFLSAPSRLCTPGMGVSLWGASPLYVNPVKVFNRLTKVLADGKGGTARFRLKEARVQSCEPTKRNGIQGPVCG